MDDRGSPGPRPGRGSAARAGGVPETGRERASGVDRHTRHLRGPMKNIIRIIKTNGGLAGLKQKAMKIEVPGYMRLCIEYIGEGPRGQAAISIAHYFEQNGDLCKDPDVVMEVPDGEGWDNS